MHARLLRALESDARTVHLGQSITIIHLDSVKVLHPSADFFRIGFGPDKGDAQLEVPAGIDPHFSHDIHEEHRIARDDMQDIRGKVPHDLYLPPAVPRSRRNGKHPEAFGSVMEAESTGEETVARKILEGIPRAGSRHVHAPSKEFGPGFDVPPGIEDRGGLPGGSR